MIPSSSPSRGGRAAFLEDLQEIDYKNMKLLKRCITEGGKIVPARLSGCSRGQQAQIKQAIKRARFLALIPYCIN